MSPSRNLKAPMTADHLANRVVPSQIQAAPGYVNRKKSLGNHLKQPCVGRAGD
jgi:hypothetical protein